MTDVEVELVETRVDEVGGSWSNALSNILKINTSKNLGSAILSKRKKLKASTQPKEEEFKETNCNKSNVQSKYLISKGRLKPNILDKDKEKSLQKIAVRGVVQLFNAVQTHKKRVNKELQTSRKSEFKSCAALKKVDRNTFFKALLGGNDRNELENKEIKMEEESCATSLWEPLHEDFMIPKMKDWDKEET